MDDDLYSGAVQQTADVGVTLPGAPQMSFGALGAVQQSAASAAQGGQHAVSNLTRMLSYKAVADATMKRKAQQTTFETEYEEMMKAAPGTARSLFLEDGSLDTDKLDDFSTRYREAVQACDPGVVLPDDRVRFDTEQADFLQTSIDRLQGKAELAVSEGVRRVSRAILDECELNEDWAGYEREVSHLNAAGILTDAEARVMLRKNDARRAVKAQKGVKKASLNVSPVQKGKAGTFDNISFD